MTEIPLPVSELKIALIGLSKIISRHTTLPVLGCIQVERSTVGAITLTANNLDQAAVVSLDSDGQGEACSILVPLKELLDVVKRCGKNDTITVEHDILRYPVSGTTAEHRFDGIPVAEFPPIPEIVGGLAPLPDSFKSSLNEAFACASDDATRYILNGAYIDVSDPKCHQIVSTNGRILYSSNSFALALDKCIVVPTHKFLGWRPFMEDGAWSMKVGSQTGEKPPVFQISSLRWRYVSRQIEGNYPNYRQVVPAVDQAKTKLELDAAGLGEIVQTIERLPCIDQENFGISLEISGKTVALLSRSTEDGTPIRVELQGVKVKGRK